MLKPSKTSPLKILFVTGGSPFPTNLGVNQRTHLIYRALADCGQVDLIINSPYVKLNESEKQELKNKYRLIDIFNPYTRYIDNNYSKSKLMNFFQQKMIDYFGPYVTNSFNDKLITGYILENNYNLIVTRYLKSAINTGVIKYSPIVLDVDDFNLAIIRDRIKSQENSFMRKIGLYLQLNLLNFIELQFLSKFEYLWFTKEEDRKITKINNSHILKNIPLIETAENQAVDSMIQNDNVALFIGSMMHNANIDGIDYFIKIIWPKIHSILDNVVLRVVGTGMKDSHRRNWNRVAGVQAVGYVENIAAEYKMCAFTVIPLKEGGGTKIKLIEALGYGRTCVANVHSVKGYEKILLDGQDILVANNDSEFVEKCIELFRNSQKRNKLAENGRRKIQAQFTYNNFKRIIEETVRFVASSDKLVIAKPVRLINIP